jgi:uncharacterized protein involved in type VI secretion and phage assembly
MAENGSNGIVVGVVTSLEDPEGLGRVQVRYPHLNDEQSDWAKLVSLMAGPERGTFFRPEVDDEVLVGLEHGDYRRPYILGALWNQKDKPPADDGKAKDNNWRFIKSRSGHIVKLDDTRGKEKIEILDKDGQRQVVLDSANGEIQVTCTRGNVKVSAKAGSVTIEARDITIKSSGNMTLDAQATMTIKGKLVKIN